MFCSLREHIALPLQITHFKDLYMNFCSMLRPKNACHKYTIWATCRVVNVKTDGTYNYHWPIRSSVLIGLVDCSIISISRCVTSVRKHRTGRSCEVFCLLAQAVVAREQVHVVTPDLQYDVHGSVAAVRSGLCILSRHVPGISVLHFVRDKHLLHELWDFVYFGAFSRLKL